MQADICYNSGEPHVTRRVLTHLAKSDAPYRRQFVDECIECSYVSDPYLVPLQDYPNPRVHRVGTACFYEIYCERNLLLVHSQSYTTLEQAEEAGRKDLARYANRGYGKPFMLLWSPKTVVLEADKFVD